LRPFLSLLITDEVEQPSKEGEPIVAAQSESPGVGGEVHCEGSGVIEDRADGVDDYLSNGPGVLVVVQQIRGDSCRPGRRQSAKLNPFSVRDGALVKANISLSALLAPGKRELVPVRGEVAYPIERRRGLVRHHALGGSALPSGYAWSQLEPRGSQSHVIWRR
jgi:hypothetical protein